MPKNLIDILFKEFKEGFESEEYRQRASNKKETFIKNGFIETKSSTTYYHHIVGLLIFGLVALFMFTCLLAKGTLVTVLLSIFFLVSGLFLIFILFYDIFIERNHRINLYSDRIELKKFFGKNTIYYDKIRNSSLLVTFMPVRLIIESENKKAKIWYLEINDSDVFSEILLGNYKKYNVPFDLSLGMETLSSFIGYQRIDLHTEYLSLISPFNKEQRIKYDEITFCSVSRKDEKPLTLRLKVKEQEYKLNMRRIWTPQILLDVLAMNNVNVQTDESVK